MNNDDSSDVGINREVADLDSNQRAIIQSQITDIASSLLSQDKATTLNEILAAVQEFQLNYNDSFVDAAINHYLAEIASALENPSQIISIPIFLGGTFSFLKHDWIVGNYLAHKLSLLVSEIYQTSGIFIDYVDAIDCALFIKNPSGHLVLDVDDDYLYHEPSIRFVYPSV